MEPGAEAALAANCAAVVRCTRCPRLVAWRELSAANPPPRFRGERYWARPVPGFGDPGASLLIVGLAPAAHGGNRTGRPFTGDRSGDWLFRALHRAGFANQPFSRDRLDRLELWGAYVAAAVRCAPPENRPAPQERLNCLPYLVRELQILETVKVLVALGSVAWGAALSALRLNGAEVPSPRPVFGHGFTHRLGGYHLIGSYHPSPHNTSTGRLSEDAFDRIFRQARRLIGTGGR